MNRRGATSASRLLALSIVLLAIGGFFGLTVGALLGRAAGVSAAHVFWFSILAVTPFFVYSAGSLLELAWNRAWCDQQFHESVFKPGGGRTLCRRLVLGLPPVLLFAAYLAYSRASRGLAIFPEIIG